MIITTKKGGFALVPEGKQIVHVDKVELMPSGKPQMVVFEYSGANGGKIKETLKFDNAIAVDILGKRCDVALDGAEEGTEIDSTELVGLFLNKTFEAEIKHTEGKKGGVFANIKYLVKLIKDEEDEEDDDL